MVFGKKAKNPRTKAVKRPAQQRVSGRDWGRFRLGVVGAFFCVVWFALWCRAFYVQIYRGPEFAAKATRQHLAPELVTGRRGSILDRNGQVLARSVASKSVFVRPVEIANPAEAARLLASALDMPLSTVRSKIQERRRFTWIARKISDRAAVTIKEARMSGIYLSTDYSRAYPNRQLAGRLLGFVGMDDQGLEGIELTQDEQLMGQDSKYVVQRDAAGRRLYLNGPERDPSIDGLDVRLTLDAQIQFFAEEALAEAVTSFEASWGGALMVDVESGDILAWAEYPPFNPNAYNRYSPSQWRNRIAADALEMGSTIKPFLVASALEEGKITPDSLYYCENGRWQLHNVRIKDTHKNEWLPVEKILRYSSNIGSAKIGLDLGAATYYSYLTRLGFGEKTGMPVRGEAYGILRPAKRWQEVDLANAAFGQGFSATMLQLAQAYVCLANGGVRKPLRVLADSPAHGSSERVFSEKTASTVLSMLRGVVEEDGTGRAARIPGISVGGKTGTAQKASPQGGYGDKYTGSFVGLIPAESPRYVLMVVVDEPVKNHYGSVIAAPAFRQIAMRSMAYMGTLPDTGEGTAFAGVEEPVVNKVVPGVSEIRRDVSRTALADDSTVPDVRGKSLRWAVEAFARKGIIPTLQGEGLFVKKQSPQPGTPWSKNGSQKYILWLSERS
ncbi:penicillin-binding transpeptidase domain-containing protein [Desulfovibrio mangrovi]|uniref:penicillin-binding transpeptidase domain-containing protein n=1 Tax=Desulfovibrio mangrovi TaxID=2976983 RepID=UPI0022474E18|nr:penicillin-binding transpeptidase domain-containing protein [Desulfovibrio mangrovi]UZP67290.1 penicillin-binding transpeptidase domain-containing protein [Desulfovibrio mangrovi]